MEHPLDHSLPDGVISLGADQLASDHPFKPGRVSPRARYKAEDFRVTELAFDDGVVLSEHSSPHTVIVQVVSGTIDVEVGGGTLRFQAGALLHLKAGVDHAVTAVEPARILLIFLH
ncbi:cupin domain-containing protein [Glutamicibacter sp. MNS18]|uniref:cupin domain-containing protein n=1 Tax=Glutamicibacter sp. MNS18 TaxID=2989817 RepID=UPI00223633C5|nr:cupin domain-containing protein [Glutamicibacter sp. MNS18]MCW4465734.1 cupin domain-containing protein [Glutamicibacter sp. MNS18]